MGLICLLSALYACSRCMRGTRFGMKVVSLISMLYTDSVQQTATVLFEVGARMANIVREELLSHSAQ